MVRRIAGRLARAVFPDKIVSKLSAFNNIFLDGYSRKSYSQEGEDLVLWVLLGNRVNRPGFYVDIGAHHPYRFSNTCIFYKNGWHGINVDATPGSMRPFRWLRRRDVNLECGISSQEGEMTYFMFDEPALNTFSEELARERQENGWKLIRIQTVATCTLGSLLDAYMPSGAKIDFLSVDVEGLDLQVLQSNDWLSYRPHIILVEVFDMELACLLESELYHYLASLDYEWVAKTFRTFFFRSKI